MWQIAAGFFGTLMVVYFLYRVLTMAAFGLLAGVFFYRHYGTYFLLLMLATAGAIVLTFIDRRGWAGLLSVVVGLGATSYWWFSICCAVHPIWYDFELQVVPELIFSFAGVCRWLLERGSTTASGQGTEEGWTH